MSDGFRRKVVSTNEMQTEEMLGSTELSILSAQLSFSSFGAGLDSIVHARKHIDGISATLWSMIPLTIRSAHGNEKAGEMLDILMDQLPVQMEKYMDMLVLIGEEADKERIKRDAENVAG